MDFGLLIGIGVVVAVGVYLWMSRTPDNNYPSDCSVETKPEINPSAPPKAEPVFAKAVIAPEAVVEEEKLTPPQKPKAKPKKSADPREEFESMTKKQIDEFAKSKGVKLDRRKKKADMITDLLDNLK